MPVKDLDTLSAVEPAVDVGGVRMAGTAATSAVIMACGLVTGLIAARSLGPDGRGQLATLTVWMMTLLYAGTLGIPEAVAYFTAAERGLRDTIWSTAQAVALALGALITAAGWLLIPFIFVGGNEALAGWAPWYLLLWAIPGFSLLCAQAWLQGLGRVYAFNLVRVTVPLVNAAGMVLLLLSRDDSVLHFAGVLLIGNAAAWAVAMWFSPLRSLRAVPPSPQLGRRMLGYGLRVQLGNWTGAVSLRLDQLLLSLLASPASLGVYVVAVNYATLLQAIPGTAMLLMLPDAVAAHRDGREAACLAQWYRRVLWVMVIAAVVLAAFSSIVISTVVGASFSSAVPLALVLLPAMVVFGMNEVLWIAFMGIGRPEVASKSEVVGLIVTVLALAALLPAFGAYGAAIASLLAYGSTHVYLLRQASRAFGVTWRSLVTLTHEDFTALRDIWAARASFGGVMQK